MIRPLLVLALIALPAISTAASFNCSKATTVVEKLVCSDEELSHLDEQLAAKYKVALGNAANQQELKTQQATWLRQVRNACSDVPCLQSAYSGRIRALSSRSNEQTVIGILRIGSLDSAIELSNGDPIGFLTDSPAAEKILAACADGDTCKVWGVIDSSDGFPIFSSVTHAVRATGSAGTPSAPSTSDLRAKHAKRIAALGFNRSILSSYLFLYRDLVNPPSKFMTFESFLAALFENPKLSSLTPLRAADGSIGLRWKLEGSPAGGVFFQFEDGEAFPTSYLEGNNAVKLETRQDKYVISVALLKMASAAL